MEKALLEECLGEGLSLEAIGKRVGKHESTVSYWLKKHGLDANGRETHAPNQKVEPERLRALVEAGVSIQEMGDAFGVGRSTIRYWLRKLGLETDRSIRMRESRAASSEGRRRAYLTCSRHGHTAFYARPEGGFRCGRCSSAAVSKRRKSLKRLLVEEAGGCCVLCGFDEHLAALQFHHVDPSTKSFSIAGGGLTRSLESAAPRQRSACCCARTAMPRWR